MIDRRRFLSGASSALALPYLPSLFGADAPRRPQVRAAWIYFPNGVAEGSWAPETTRGKLRELHPLMESLAPRRDDLLFVDRLHTPAGNGHGAGTATWLTGGDWDFRGLSVGRPSVDQVAARAVGAASVVPTLTIGTRGEGYFAADLQRNHISWRSPTRPAFRENEPRAIFRRLFGAGPQTDRSVLDDLVQQARDLRRTMGRADQQKLDEYLEAIRGIERRIAFAATADTKARMRRAAELGLAEPSASPASHEEYVDQLLDLVVLAFWTGASSLATVMLDHGQSNRYCEFVPGVKGTWHALSHWRDFRGDTEDDDGVTKWSSERSKRGMYDAVVRWHHERFARFLGRLASLEEGGERLLDQSVVFYGSSISDGHEHGEQDLPIVVAGKGGGAIRSGRRIPSRRHVSVSSLHLATLQALGVDEREFADADEPFDWS